MKGSRTVGWGYMKAFHAIGSDRCRAACSVLLAAVALCLCVSFSLTATTPAQAATGHPYLQSLTEAPTGTKLQEPTALALDHKTGQLFSADAAAGVVNVFDSTGTYLTQIGEGSLFAVGIAVDEASGLVYVADSFQNAILVFKPNGASYELLSEWAGESLPAQEFDEITGVAVDNSESASAGDVYVIDAEDPELSVGVADVFKPKPPGPEEGQEGDLVRVLSEGKMEEPNGVAVDSASGRVYVADSARAASISSPPRSRGRKADGQRRPQRHLLGHEEEEGNVTAVAIDQGTGDLLVAEDERHVVSEFDAAGEWVGWITNTPSGALGETFGVAVASCGRRLCRGRGARQGRCVRPRRRRPGRRSPPKPPNHSHDSDPQWNAQRRWQSRALLLPVRRPPKPWARAQHPRPSPAAKKRSRARSRTARGHDLLLPPRRRKRKRHQLRPDPRIPDAPGRGRLSTGPVKNLQPESATLTGSLSPNGFDAHYYFQWGTTTAYGNESPRTAGHRRRRRKKARSPPKPASRA